MVVASITPAAVNRDSRTFKQAASIARFGHRSIVVEGETSPARTGEGMFELISAAATDPGPDSNGAAGVADGQVTGFEHLNLGGRARLRVLRALEPVRSPFAHLRENASVRAALPEADVYIAHGWNRLPAAWSAARVHGGVVVYDAHDSYFERYPEGEDPYAYELTRRTFASVEKAMARRAGAFLTVTEGVADLLEHRIGRRPDVLFNYPDTRIDRDGGEDVRTVVGAGERDFVLVSVGNAKAGMDVEAGIEAIALLPERFRLVLIGAGMEGYRSRVRDRGLEDRVHLLAPLPPDRVNRFISSADAGVILYYGLTRDFEVALPNRLFHALAAGLPILYPALREIAALARKYDLGSAIDSRDPDSIAAAAVMLAEDRGMLDRLRGAVARARRELTWERQEPLLELVIGRALEDGRPGRR